MLREFDRVMKKRMFSALAWALVLTTIFAMLFCIEIGLRTLGFEPWLPDRYRGKSECDYKESNIDPAGKPANYRPMLGLANPPGIVKATMWDGYVWYATNLDNGLRITHPVESYEHKQSKPKSEIWVLGCSVTYGFGLRDDQTYPWLLQSHLPQYEIRNWGALGYGTLHSFIQLQEAFKSEKRPLVVVLAYASFHDDRNTMFRPMRKIRSSWVGQNCFVVPYARIGPTGALHVHAPEEVCYNELPLMRYSAFIHILERTYNAADRFFHTDHSVSVTREIFRQIIRLCQQNEVCPVVAGITQDPSTGNVLAFCESLGAKVIDISVDVRLAENRLLQDPHPSAKAHEHYASALHSFLVRHALNCL